MPSVQADGTHPVFKVRKPSTRVMVGLLSTLGIETSRAVSREEAKEAIDKILRSEEGKEKLLKAMEDVVVHSVVEPRIVPSNVAPKKDELNFDELELEDEACIIENVLELSGLTEKAAQEREKFRRESSS